MNSNLSQKQKKAKKQKANDQLLNAAAAGEIARLMEALSSGADFDAKNEYGRTAAMWAAWDGHEDCLRTLISAGADLDAKDNDGWTAAMFAAGYGHGDCLRMLAEAGADLEATTNDGKTALSWATLLNRPEEAALIEARLLVRHEKAELSKGGSVKKNKQTRTARPLRV